MSVDNGLVGLIAVIVTGIGTWRALAWTKKMDKSTASAVLVASHSQEVSQIIDGLNRLVENLQEDNRVWRETVATIEAKLKAVIRERDECRSELLRLNKMLDEA